MSSSLIICKENERKTYIEEKKNIIWINNSINDNIFYGIQKKQGSDLTNNELIAFGFVTNNIINEKELFLHDMNNMEYKKSKYYKNGRIL